MSPCPPTAARKRTLSDFRVGPGTDSQLPSRFSITHNQRALRRGQISAQPSDEINETAADASSAAAKSQRRRALSAAAGGCAELGCSRGWAAADRLRAQS